MELVCGITGLNAEQLKGIRKQCLTLGFNCRLNENGWLCFKEEGNSNWNGLLGIIGSQEGILPLYYKEGNRRVGLEYGKLCIKGGSVEKIGSIGLVGLFGLKNILLGKRLGSIYRILLEKNGKN